GGGAIEVPHLAQIARKLSPAAPRPGVSGLSRYVSGGPLTPRRICTQATAYYCYVVSAAIEPGVSEARRKERREAAAKRRRGRRRRLVGAAVVVLLTPAIYSYTAWMMQPSSLSFGVRSVEWIQARPG